MSTTISSTQPGFRHLSVACVSGVVVTMSLAPLKRCMETEVSYARSNSPNPLHTSPRTRSQGSSGTCLLVAISAHQPSLLGQAGRVEGGPALSTTRRQCVFEAYGRRNRCCPRVSSHRIRRTRLEHGQSQAAQELQPVIQT